MPADPSNGTAPLPHCSGYRPSMRRGSTRCPRRCATAPLARPCRPSSISISTNWPASSRRVALGETDGAVPHQDRGSPTGVRRYPPRRRSLHTERRSLPARVPPMDSVDDLLRPCRVDRSYAARGVNSSCRQGVNSECRLTLEVREAGCASGSCSSGRPLVEALIIASRSSKAPQLECTRCSAEAVDIQWRLARRLRTQIVQTRSQARQPLRAVSLSGAYRTSEKDATPPTKRHRRQYSPP
jgi:hypothetical protein